MEDTNNTYKKMSAEQVVSIYTFLTSYFSNQKNPNFVQLENGEKFTKRDLKHLQKIIISLTKSSKKKKEKFPNPSKTKILPTYISDQLVDFFKNSNYGLGIADFLIEKNYPHSLLEDGSTKKVQDKVKKFLKSEKLYPDAKLFYKDYLGEVDVSNIEDSQIDNLINFKHQMDIVLSDRISTATFKLSLWSFIDSIRKEYNEKFTKRRLVNDIMEKCFGKGTNTGSFIDGVQINLLDDPTEFYIRDIQKSGLDRLSELQPSTQNGKVILTFIPEDKSTEDGEYGYLHTAIMSLYNYYSIDINRYNLTEEQVEKLKNTDNFVMFEKLQLRVKSLKKIHLDSSKSN